MTCGADAGMAFVVRPVGIGHIACIDPIPTLALPCFFTIASMRFRTTGSAIISRMIGLPADIIGHIAPAAMRGFGIVVRAEAGRPSNASAERERNERNAVFMRASLRVIDRKPRRARTSSAGSARGTYDGPHSEPLDNRRRTLSMAGNQALDDVADSGRCKVAAPDRFSDDFAATIDEKARRQARDAE